MTELLLSARDYYWQHRDLFRAAAAITTIALVNGTLLFWIARRLQELSLLRERVSRLADGLALLTDTTEAGLATLVREVEQLGRRRTTAKTGTSTRASVSKRVAAAVRNGEPIARVAETESLSESEVGLHLSMARREASASEPAA